MHQIQPLFEKLQNIPGLCRIRIDLNGKIMYLNNAFRNRYRHINYPYEGTDILQFVTREERLKCKDIASRCTKCPSSIIRTKLHHFDASGKKVWTQWEFMLMSDSYESIKGIEGLGMDITDYMIEDATAQYVGDRQHITEQGVTENSIGDDLNIVRCGITEVVKAKESERIRIAAELHDNVNQLLGTALLYLSLANSDSDHIPELLPKTIDLIGKSIIEIRSLSNPDTIELENCSVVDEIKEIANSIMMTLNIVVTCNFDSTITCSLTDFEKLNVLRIVQEATNNIIKHANATKINIDIRKAGKKLELRITDDGKGFHADRIKRGAGLLNIRYRAKLLKARHILQSKPGQGTCLYVAMPYAGGEEKR